MNNCITELLQIKDKNIIIDPTFKKEKIKGQTHFIFKGVLTYKPTKCECCNSNKVVKNGFNEPTETIRHTLTINSKKTKI